MNYDTLRNDFDMQYHGKVYRELLDVRQFRDKKSGIQCLRVEILEEESGKLKTLIFPSEEATFKRKEMRTCEKCKEFDDDCGWRKLENVNGLRAGCCEYFEGKG